MEVIFQSIESTLTRHQKAKEGWHKNHRHLCLYATSTSSTCSSIWVPGLQVSSVTQRGKTPCSKSSLLKAPYSLSHLSQSTPPHSYFLLTFLLKISRPLGRNFLNCHPAEHPLPTLRPLSTRVFF